LVGPIAVVDDDRPVDHREPAAWKQLRSYQTRHEVDQTSVDAGWTMISPQQQTPAA
jgi:hypothetical protein